MPSDFLANAKPVNAQGGDFLAQARPVGTVAAPVPPDETALGRFARTALSTTGLPMLSPTAATPEEKQIEAGPGGYPALLGSRIMGAVSSLPGQLKEAYQYWEPRVTGQVPVEQTMEELSTIKPELAGIATGVVAGDLLPKVGAAASQISLPATADINTMIGTTPERIGELGQVPQRMASVQRLAHGAEKAIKAKTGAMFPEVQEPIVLSRETVEEPTGLVDQSGNPLTKSIEKVQQTTFPELQQKYSDLSERIRDEQIAVNNGAPRFELRKLLEEKSKVNDLMTEAAEKEGKLQQLQKAREAWRKYEDDFHNPNSPFRKLLRTSPDKTAEIASHLRAGTNAARMSEILKSYGLDASPISDVMAKGRKPLAVDVAESGKLRTQGSPEAYRTQRLRESLRQATTNEMSSGAEARLPAAVMRSRFPGILGDVPLRPRNITAMRLATELGKAEGRQVPLLGRVRMLISGK